MMFSAGKFKFYIKQRLRGRNQWQGKPLVFTEFAKAEVLRVGLASTQQLPMTAACPPKV